jgi:hypothetical protein
MPITPKTGSLFHACSHRMAGKDGTASRPPQLAASFFRLVEIRPGVVVRLRPVDVK